jgi:hypothetical protein
MITKLLAMAAVAALVLAGCADTPNGGGTPAPTTASETTGEPSPEPTTPETTQTSQKKPSISIATAPIGGDTEEDGVEHCAQVDWLGRKPLPDGASLRLGSPSLEPTGVFELDQSACPSERRSCTNLEWRGENPDTCYVGARQVANGTGEVRLIMPVEATCESQKDCDSLAEETNDKVVFRPDIIETPSTESPTTETTPNG